MIRLLMLAAAPQMGIAPISDRELPDFICLENARSAFSSLGWDPAKAEERMAVGTALTFFAGRLSVMDEKRDWNGEATRGAAQNDSRISERAMEVCVDRYQQYILPEWRAPR
jgi:hypothetical protein